MGDKYIIIAWPESQMLMEQPGFEDNCYLIVDERGMENFGSGAYFVNEDWYLKTEGEGSGV